MKKIITLFLSGIFIVFLSVDLRVFPQDKDIPVIIDGDEVSYFHQEDKVSAKGNVVIKYKDVVINCDEAVYDVKTNIASIKGEVKINSDEKTILGEDVVYDFKAKRSG